jgi:CSLREA domain-containing protein
VSLARRVGLVLVFASAVLVPVGEARAAATVTVGTFEDSFDGSCADADCSLRDAIADVDAGGTVRVPAGFYSLSLSGTGGVGEGDLDVTRRMTLIGVGETGAFLDASGLGDRCSTSPRVCGSAISPCWEGQPSRWAGSSASIAARPG